ncbi:MAG TPA: sugar ABC transporter permease [Actinomycetota bacterium]|nr:sugar ABC transporter permease [Actinomycetota bacterium]
MRRPALLAAPFLVGVGLLVVVPAVAAAVLAFTEFSGVQPPRFNGLDNLERLLSDTAFWRATGNTLIYVAIAVPLRLAAATFAALALHRRARSSIVARPIVYLPSVVPDAAYALLWLWLLNPLYGPLATVFGASGILTSPWGARIALPLIAVFQIGEAFVVALAVRRSIPADVYEAAAMDGASPWFTTTRLTLPLMAPVLALLALRDLVFSLQVNFVPALLLTDGGPRYATTYLPLYVYRTAFRYFRLGYASTMALSMFVVTALIVYVQYRLFKRWRSAA